MNNNVNQYTVKPIGFIRTCFPEKFGIPRQPLLAPNAVATLSLEPPFNDPDCVAGLEGVSHVWLSFIFHEHSDKPYKLKVRPPRLGGNKKMGVFATRSSFRPNHLGLSVVKLEKVTTENQQVCLHFSGVDLLDGTPIVDIKPYVPYVDSIADAENTFAASPPDVVSVVFSSQAKAFCQSYHRPAVNLYELIIQVLQQDPRPAYHDKKACDRVYGIALVDCNIQWRCVASGDKVGSVDLQSIYVEHISKI